MFLSVARDRADPKQRWIFDMQEEALSVATESERRTAIALAEDFLEKGNEASASMDQRGQ
jgi:hypothetical protein